MTQSTPTVVFITGCSSGIGRAAALAFAQRGDTVIATVRTSTDADALRQRLESVGARAEIVLVDVTDNTSVTTAISSTITGHGRIDVLVNNAGLSYQGTLEELAIDDLQRSLDVNFLGAARVMKAVLAHMRANGSGHIINVSSVAGSFGQPFNDAYCAAKFALEGLCESLCPVAAMFGVHVVVFEPGAVSGEFTAKGAGVRDVDPASPFARMRANYDAMMVGAMAGAATPEDMAAYILDIADDPTPPPRVQAPESTARLIGAKLKDLSGERVVGITTKWLG